MQHTVLVVDDEPSICWALEKMLESEGHRTVVASSAEEGLRMARDNQFSVLFLDVRLPGVSGIEALPRFREYSNAPVIIITAFGDLETAVTAVQQGASEYVTKPFKLDAVLNTFRRTLAKHEYQTDNSPQPAELKPTLMVGQSPAMQDVFRQIAMVAQSELSVLVTGETGTGKELVASAIHRFSRRAEQPYIPIAPVALNPELVESELFGHVRGAFTGADNHRVGLFQQADGGTILLDEIGDLPMNVQVKLLRVLEQGEFFRVGDLQPHRVDVRIVAATHCDLLQAVQEGRFRADLFHRLCGMRVHLPPLRERLEDLELLCHHFLSQLPGDAPDLPLSEALMRELRQRPWHGNIRELRNAIEHASVLARGSAITIDDFPPPNPGSSSESTDGLSAWIGSWTAQRLEAANAVPGTLHGEFLATVEPILIARVLEHTEGNRAKAAEILGLHRSTLRERLRAYDMDG